jgi:hypothetical protein
MDVRPKLSMIRRSGWKYLLGSVTGMNLAALDSLKARIYHDSR